MNRKERRGAAKFGKVNPNRAQIGPGVATPSVAELTSLASEHHQQRQYAKAEYFCRQILSRDPAHIEALNLLGVIAQGSGRHTRAIKLFEKAIAANKISPAAYYNIAVSYQALHRQNKAVPHFCQAITLGMTDRDVSDHIKQNPIIGASLERIKHKWPLPVRPEELFGNSGVDAIARDAFFRSAMISIVIGGWQFEKLLTCLRSSLLRLAETKMHEPSHSDDHIIDCFCALAQQCFMNEYIFAENEADTRLAMKLRNDFSTRLASGDEVPVPMLAAVATYFPLHSLAGAELLLQRDWPESAAALLRQQVLEPLEEVRDRNAIPVLTAVDDSVSLQVMQQYEENPYPRWTLKPLPVTSGARDMLKEAPGSAAQRVPKNILIAGCGTGQHVFAISGLFPEAQVLAVDISLASIAFARRKTREEGLHNIEYAQADILRLGTIGRDFDRIEAIGVLHHLADPKVGWRILLSLLQPEGVMRVALYSKLARRAVAEARTLIAEHGYRAAAEDIRKCREQILRGNQERWKDLIGTIDFYTMSGCRDLLFNVMEHRFTIPELKTFLREHGLSFLGFELKPEIIDMFQRQFPGADALKNLDHWHEFESVHTQTFLQMYLFSVCRAM